MIHDWDSHYWMAKLPSGKWISAANHSSFEPIFQTATKIRIEPLSSLSAQAVLEAEVPDGYTAFLRTDRVEIVMKGPDADNTPKLIYVMALERGYWPDPGRVALSTVPLRDGFRAELQIFPDGHGEVDFSSSGYFISEVKNTIKYDLYRFIKV
ncbi:hypothetical protein ASZ90_013160 [hydrocarbon metagenome]|jgi:hypothetical protein|uniref:Uncharacterized protein n=1 Tax=hydrocarbon metagenome TaxID=938273 RepID=A0A0W8F8G9_9ZZZZ